MGKLLSWHFLGISDLERFFLYGKAKDKYFCVWLHIQFVCFVILGEGECLNSTQPD